jgi:hypothetical protein
MQFVPYPKTPRLKRPVVITEKIDGTNAQIVIARVKTEDFPSNVRAAQSLPGDEHLVMLAGSRSRWITPGKERDNFGFAQWVQDNADALWSLGEGQHFGEWYGAGIQRTYGLDHKRFALFNTARWGSHNPNTPACCEVVPVLPFQDHDEAIDFLRTNGTTLKGADGHPAEGVIVFHTASKTVSKVLIENDNLPKGAL